MPDVSCAGIMVNRKQGVGHDRGWGGTGVGVSSVPSERVRIALAKLDPRACPGTLSKFAGFLPVLHKDAQRLAPHWPILTGTGLSWLSFRSAFEPWSVDGY